MNKTKAMAKSKTMIMKTMTITTTRKKEKIELETCRKAIKLILTHKLFVQVNQQDKFLKKWWLLPKLLNKTPMKNKSTLQRTPKKKKNMNTRIAIQWKKFSTSANLMAKQHLFLISCKHKCLKKISWLCHIALCWKTTIFSTIKANFFGQLIMISENSSRIHSVIN